jgi:histone acetyltransferase SAS3
MAAMASAAAYGNAALDRKPLLEDSDQDAEGEEDVEVYQPIQPFQDGATTPGQEDNTCLEGEQQQNNVLDVEMKVGDEEEIPNAPEEEGVAGTYEEAPATKATQLPEAELHSGTDADEGDDASYHSEFSGSGAKAAPDVVSSSEEESEAEEEWEAESNDQDDAEAEQASLNLCM